MKECRGFLGILMLETRFPRLAGDIGHAGTFAGPVLRRVVDRAHATRVVTSAAAFLESDLAERFVHAAQVLEQKGAFAITTSCGFLVLIQQRLQAAVRVPVVTSSLLQLPGLLATEASVGVLTIDAEALGPAHLCAAGVPESRLGDVIVQGMAPDSHFRDVILGDMDAIDTDRAEAEVVEVVLALKRRAPKLRHLVLECTNLPPHADVIRARTGLTLHSLVDAFDTRGRPHASRVQEPPRPPIEP